MTTLIGSSGRAYEYMPLLVNGDWNNVPGNYAFGYEGIGTWRILYVGETGSFSTRFPHHERWAEAIRLGATHVLGRLNQLGEANRLAEERDLISAYNPPLNKQHRPQELGLAGLLRSGPLK